MIFDEDEFLMHYGILRKSGRYPWGSGETQSARNKSFLDTVDELRKSGMSEAEIAKGFSTPDQPFTTSDLRALKSIAGNQQKMENIARAQKLQDKGLSNVAIGKAMGLNESSVRNLLAPGAADRADSLHQTVDMLRRQVEDKKYLDVGTQSAAHLGINDTKLKTAIAALKEEGYRLHYLKEPQVGTGQETTMRVLTKGEVTPKEVWHNRSQIQQIQEISYTGGHSWTGKQPPISIDSSRIHVNYKENGGDKADGVIYVRPGVHDLDMGGKRYAQVRIAVDGSHYLKGMAVYKDDLPKGVDLVFNTNKSNTGNKLDAMKPLKRDRDGNIDKGNPFGAMFDQLPKLNEHGAEIEGTVRSALNLVNEEGKWDTWSRNLSTQFLSKQSPSLAREQLDMTYERRKAEFDEIMSLTNPVVKKRLLASFAEDADAAAVHLKAMAMPRQRTQVILPISSLKDTEIYAPNFNNGERVVLVRHPHGGRFEIPELTVNNKNAEGQKLLGPTARDAVGINHNVAKRLSGADFDGDTVLVIPNNTGRVKTERGLEELKNFDPQAYYKAHDGMKTIDGGTYHEATGKVVFPAGKSPNGQLMQTQMGLISNLITDMTIKGASNNELAAAVRHSMVVIDAEKHHLDYKRSARDNGIPALVRKYQPREDQKNIGGSSTLISRAKGDLYVPERKQGYKINPLTGEKIYAETGATYVNRKGQTVEKKTRTTKLAEAKDAHSLSSGTNIEDVYANHSNRLKALANEARKQQVRTPNIEISRSAKDVYAPQVNSLKAKLNIALQNAPRERQAQLLANALVAQRKQAYDDLDAGDMKKIKGQALAEARIRTGAKKTRIDITDDEWAAIQAGAVSSHQLSQILQNTNLDDVKKRATPRTPTVMTDIRLTRAKSMLDMGYSQSDVAAQLGVPVSTLQSSLDRG